MLLFWIFCCAAGKGVQGRVHRADRGMTEVLTENPGKIMTIVVANGICHLGHVQGALRQELPGTIHAQRRQVGKQRKIAFLAEHVR